jgi:hypothetical protein
MEANRALGELIEGESVNVVDENAAEDPIVNIVPDELSLEREHPPEAAKPQQHLPANEIDDVLSVESEIDHNELPEPTAGVSNEPLHSIFSDDEERPPAQPSVSPQSNEQFPKLSTPENQFPNEDEFPDSSRDSTEFPSELLTPANVIPERRNSTSSRSNSSQWSSEAAPTVTTELPPVHHSGDSQNDILGMSDDEF